jgi:hypothetical protein
MVTKTKKAKADPSPPAPAASSPPEANTRAEAARVAAKLKDRRARLELIWPHVAKWFEAKEKNPPRDSDEEELRHAICMHYDHLGGTPC